MNPCGTRQRFTQGCRCDPCRKAWNAYNLSRIKARKNGDWKGLVPTKGTRTHIERLNAPICVIARAAGVSRDSIRLIASGARRRTTQATRDAILAVTPKDIYATYPLLAPNAFAPGQETKQQLEALKRSGFSGKELGRKVGLTELRLMGKRVTVKNAKRVEKLYRTLGTKAA